MPMTYTSLRAQILSYLNRSDPSTEAQVDNFIAQAQQRIASQVESIGNDVSITDTLTPDNNRLIKPSRWRRTTSFTLFSGDNYATMSPLLPRSMEYMRFYWPNQSLTAVPLYYADWDPYNWYVTPTPDLAYPVQYNIVQLPEPLTEDSQTNWYTDNAPQLLLYASLLEAEPFLMNPNDVKMYAEFVERAINLLNGDQGKRTIDRSVEAQYI